MAATTLGRPAYLLEKDLWVVWALRELFTSPLGEHLTFKGGTSLSKVYRLIDRFSEDIDLTYDIRRFIPELTDGEQMPRTRSQESKWTRQIRASLPGWIEAEVCPVLSAALEREHLGAGLQVEDDKLFVHYPALTPASDYVRPAVLLEFGARSSGEPHRVHPVTCDMAEAIQGVDFPQAEPVVMEIARTFWEKATATHVYCVQHRLKGERFARHWHDLAAIARSDHLEAIAADKVVAGLVAEHKSCFFREKDANGNEVDYRAAVTGGLRIVPDGDARKALADDYARMLEGGMMVGEPFAFDDLMDACEQLQQRLNGADCS
ncbi:nucleotidyl transferase AbiEii/AbiGii toxin family protein [Pseudomonas sp. GCM10022186]|uniref:nucleotidyl transferase AbiEii/AbiGii toxin family protein n=1 Tax=Pseudomonas sp. GCM10022186 TaxID=3252650 RepID=UPI0036097539